jgi:two-component system phosphate regulon sensor histidine kinase PhoR
VHLRWKLLGINALLALLAVWLVAGRGSLAGEPLFLVAMLILVLGVSLGEEWALAGPWRRLAGRIRQAAAAPPEEDIWNQKWALAMLPELGTALEDLRQRVHQRLGHLNAEKSRLEVILESITEGILVTGRDGRVVLANQALARLFGLKLPLQGRPNAEIVRHSEVQEAIAQCLERCAGTSLEISLKGGPESHLDVQVAPIRKGQECIGVVSVFYDITRLRQLERMRRDFVANVSHELRTPLTAIKGYAETLADGALDDRQAAGRFVQVIASHADRLTRLLDDLLDLSRLESEQFEVNWGKCRLRRLVDTCLGSVSQLAAQKKIGLQVEIPEEIEVHCDAKLIEQALINLLDNAVKYTPEGGAVRVGVRVLEKEGKERLALEVADTGIGIPSEDLGRIFERFYRVDKGRSRALGGTGLGLSIVRHIAQVHGEKVWVQSQLGRGSTFSLTLRRA